MRLQMMLKRPVTFPDLDPEMVLSQKHTKGMAEALQAYGEALLNCNESCMEACESAAEVVRCLKRHHRDIYTRGLGGDRFALKCGKVALLLESRPDDSIQLVFTPGSAGTDVSDFGAEDVARFIMKLFASYDRVASARNMNI